MSEAPAFFSAAHRAPWRGPSSRATQGAATASFRGCHCVEQRDEATSPSHLNQESGGPRRLFQGGREMSLPPYLLPDIRARLALRAFGFASSQLRWAAPSVVPSATALPRSTEMLPQRGVMLHHAILPLMPFAGSRRDRLANGNRLTKIEGADNTTYAYTAGTNRLATATGSEPGSYGYDANGNTTSDGTHTYQYSQRGRLATVDTGTTAAYSYDGDGRRVKKVAGGTTTIYFYDNDGKLLEEYVPATGAGKDYVWLPGTYEPMARVDFAMSDSDNGNVLRVTKASPNVHLDWSLDGTSGPFVLKRSLSFTFSNPVYLGPGQMTKTFDDAVLNNATAYAYEAFRRTLTDTLYFYHADHLGTPIAMTNGAGALVWRAEHTPFGGIYALTVGTITDNLCFPGQYYDGETGLAQNYFRDYNNRTGRYWEPDPIGLLSEDSNIYGYALQNPLFLMDFSGEKAFPYPGNYNKYTENAANKADCEKKCDDWKKDMEKWLKTASRIVIWIRGWSKDEINKETQRCKEQCGCDYAG